MTRTALGHVSLSRLCAALIIIGILAVAAYSLIRGTWVEKREALADPSVSSLSTLHPPRSTPQESDSGPTPGLPWFEDVTAASGIDFQHFDSATPRQYIMETLGSGLAWIDYNNDGWPDLFCVQDGPVFAARFPEAPPTSKLYRNNGDGTFTDVTKEVGLARPGYGLGCAVGDFDNDGFDDLVVTYWGGIVLYHNESDGKGGRRFVDVTAKAGLHDPHLATSCAWGDINNDGFLDLYVCNYCEIDLEHYPSCESTPGHTAICPPTAFPPTPHVLYRNNGNGTFTDISVKAGIKSVSAAPGLGVIMVDLDGDGLTDIYVANDMKPAYLFHNQGGGRFVEKGLLTGVAYGPRGTLVAGMGVEAGDLDGSGWPSLFVTNFQHKPNVLYRNMGKLLFQEWSNPSGLGPPSVDRLGFGTVFVDSTLAGHLDVAVANGHVDRNIEQFQGIPFAQEPQFFVGDGHCRFRDRSDRVGPYFRQRRVGRGLAWADYDNDGRPDLAFSHIGGPIALLQNRTSTPNNWIRLELWGDGKKSNRNAIGARVEIETKNGKQVRFVIGGGSYLSASDRRLLVGLGSADQAERIMVLWPSGRRQKFRNLAAKHWWRLNEGKDQPEEIRLPRRGA